MNTQDSGGGFGAEYEQVLAANVALHSRMAKDYNTVEPHFRPENVARVEERLRAACERAGEAKRMLDLGCGTGFMIQIAKKFVAEIDGVDATASMLAVVDRSGPAQIRLFEGDTGSYPLEESRYDVATAYSFLHHLYDIRPTLAAAHRALRPGGVFYSDLDPNYYFWEAIKDLDPAANYDPIVSREIGAVTAKDEEIAGKFGVSKEVFNQAEYGKAITGGFKEEELSRELRAAGFTDIRMHYYWFVGQGAIVNAPGVDAATGQREARLVEGLLDRALPLSRTLFKYVGFTATAAK
jgi:ubiquinone/menaquinone biosynthesis C-methylase UbiE